jgi:hypothetical protein
MANVATFAYPEEWKIGLQMELDEPNKWQDICNVRFTNTRVLHNPYITDLSLQTPTRGSAYTYQQVNITDESTLINQLAIAANFVDRADLAQWNLSSYTDLATRHGVVLKEQIETAVLGAYGSMTTFDNADLGGAAGSITLSTTNVDDVMVNIRKKIFTAAGQRILEQNGAFIVWRPGDFATLELYARANGYQLADIYLKSGTQQGMVYGGFTHYSSNLLSGGHVVAGVKRSIDLGLLDATYGQTTVVQEPQATSGIGITSRIDYKVFVWTRMKPVVYDVRLA